MIKYDACIDRIELKLIKSKIKRVAIRQSKDIAPYIKGLFNKNYSEIKERIVVLFLNGSNTTIGWMIHTEGGSVSAVMDPNLIVATALQCGAKNIVISHNHPSGQMRASAEDKNITNKLRDALALFNMKILDHIIVPGDLKSEEYYSFADNGEL